MRVHSRARLRGLLCGIAAATNLFSTACAPDTSSSGADAQTAQQAFGALPSGGLVGTLRASYHAVGTAMPPLPGADVWTQNVATGSTSLHVQSDYNGRYYIPAAAGDYKLCWAKQGFTSACSAATFHIANSDVGAGYTPVAVATTRVVRGHVALHDLSPCLNQDALFGIKQSALAQTLDATNAVLKSGEPDAEGDFVLPWDPTATRLVVSCQQASVAFSLTETGSGFDSTGTIATPVTLRNSRPTITSLAATASGVDARQGVAPGTVVALAASTTDPDGSDVLTYHWKAPVNAGTLVDTATPNASWTVPAIPGTYSAYLAVDDQHGGFVTHRIEVKVINFPTVLMSGTVHDPAKNPISGATVTSGSLTTTTDALGNFTLTVPRTDIYSLSIEREGFAELSRRMTTATLGQEYILHDAFKVALDLGPRAVNVITDKRPSWLKGARYQRVGGTVTIPPGALDLTTVPPIGTLNAYITTIDPTGEDMTGDMGAVTSAGTAAYLVSYGAVAIEIRDRTGTKFNLAAGKTATIEVPIQPPLRSTAPSTIATWTFDPRTGDWAQLPGLGTRVGDVYRFTVNHFSTKNADLARTDPACVRVHYDPGLPRPIKTFINVEVAPGAPRRREADLANDDNIIYNLPPNTPYTLDIYDSTDVRLDTLTGTTPAAWGGPGIPPANAACDNKSITGAQLGIPVVPNAFTRFLSRKGTGDLPTGNAYYGKIDPLTLRGNLKAFFLKNGFASDGSGGTRTTFINNGDLGFGRDMHCLKTGNDVACYVSNYGQPDQSPGNFTLALAANKPDVRKTVAMEYSAIEGDPNPSARVVKFYVYDGACTDEIQGCGGINSPRSPSANLDGAGEKFVPNLCNTCHGGSYVPSDASHPTLAEVKMGASFLPFDIASYRDGTAGPKPNDPAFGLTNIHTQEAGFHDQNQLVLDTQPVQPIRDLIGLFYPSGATVFDGNATPCGWRQSTAGCGGGFSGGTGNAATETLYRDVIAKTCRSCHIAQRTDIAWDTYRKLAVEQFAVGDQVCKSGAMPHSYIAFRNFWRSNGPHQPESLAAFGQPFINTDSPAWTALGTCALP